MLVQCNICILVIKLCHNFTINLSCGFSKIDCLPNSSCYMVKRLAKKIVANIRVGQIGHNTIPITSCTHNLGVAQTQGYKCRYREFDTIIIVGNK